jgi:hypothetical protein
MDCYNNTAGIIGIKCIITNLRPRGGETLGGGYLA